MADANDAQTDQEQHPKGTLLLTLVFLVGVIAVWGYTFYLLAVTELTMLIERYEKIFLALAGVVLIAAVIGVGLSVSEVGAHLPGDEGKIDPREVRSTAPFDEPGVFEIGPGEYEVVMIAQAWTYDAGADNRAEGGGAEIRIPAGSEVTFTVTTPDVTHGFYMNDPIINAMVVPGQITKVKDVPFDDPGEYLFLCHEYCGIGHHKMAGKVIAE